MCVDAGSPGTLEHDAAIEHLDFAIAGLQDMKMQPALERRGATEGVGASKPGEITPVQAHFAAPRGANPQSRSAWWDRCGHEDLT